MSRLPTVFLVDPDGLSRDAITKLAGLMNLDCEAFETGQEFVAAFDPTRPGCLVTEIKVPGMNGLQIQQRLRDLGSTLPVIFISSGPSVSIAVNAMRSGALHFLEKPVRENDLWNAIQEALQLDEWRRQVMLLKSEVDQLVAMLTEKEQTVLEMIADGLAKSAIASELGVSVRTVEHYRTQLMRKLQTNSLADLMQFASNRIHGHPPLRGESGFSRLIGSDQFN
jgi:two-component system, LuxR family, response regulator FixJ